MSDIAHGKRCANARKNGIRNFYLARGHSTIEADDFTERHFKRQRVGTPAEEATPISELQQKQPVLAAASDSGSDGELPTAT